MFVRGDDPHNPTQTMAFIQDQFSVSYETIVGTDGNDLIMWSGGDDLIDGGYGHDVLTVNMNSDEFTISTQDSGLTYLNEIPPGFVLGNGFGDAVLMNIEQIEFLDKTVTIGTAEYPPAPPAPTPAPTPVAPTPTPEPTEFNDIVGTKKDDLLIGTNKDDLILGSKGDDSIQGGAGDDFIVGGKGIDIVAGGEGMDVFAISKKMGKGKNNYDEIAQFEVGEDCIFIDGNTKGIWIDSFQGHAVIVRGKNDVLAFVEGAAGQLDWFTSPDGNTLIM